MTHVRSTSRALPLLAGAALAASSAWAQQTSAAAPLTAPASVQASSGNTQGPQAVAGNPAELPAPPRGQSAPRSTLVPEATVSVSAAKLSGRIDRQVYDVKTDPATSNDTVADTLNKVPSLAVDADGKVTLRGRSNVQILIDGKPSAMMQGDNRAAAINALSASDLESVEVINNPGAQFGSEGGGGPIVNLVMRRERTPGGVGALNANVSNGGDVNTSAFGSYAAGRMSVQGSVFRRHDERSGSGENRRERIDPATGGLATSTQLSDGENRSISTGFNTRLSYHLDERSTLSMSANAMRHTSDNDSLERYRSMTATGMADSEYVRSSVRHRHNRSYDLAAGLERKGSLAREVFRLDLRVSGADTDDSAGFASRYTVRPTGAADSVGRQANLGDSRLADLTGDYERPLGAGLLRLGYKLARTSNAIDVRYFDAEPGGTAETLNRSRSNRFELDDSIVAAYGSYQYRIDSKWSALGGLRAEHSELDLSQLTSGVRAANRSTDLIPSAFLTYGWSDDATLRLSYSQRLRRPGASELNPFVIYRDEQNLASGNPELKPSQSDSIELGIETRIGQVETNLRLYARRDTDLISQRRILLENDVLLTTHENRGSGNSGGIEFTLSGKASGKLTLNASGNIGYSEQAVPGKGNGDAGKRSAVALMGKARLVYQTDARNQLQLVLNAQGKQLFGESYRKPSHTADLSYRHQLSPALSLVLNVRDLFDSQNMETVTETERLREVSLHRSGGREVFVGVSYRFRGGQPMRNDRRQAPNA